MAKRKKRKKRVDEVDLFKAQPGKVKCAAHALRNIMTAFHALWTFISSL